MIPVTEQMRMLNPFSGAKTMIDALIAGKLHGQPAQRTSKTGKPFVTAKVRTHVGDADVFVNVITFSETSKAALLALSDGDSVALSGALKPSAWTDREGNARPSLDMTVSAVLTAYHVTKKRKAIAESDKPLSEVLSRGGVQLPHHTQHRFDDGLDDGEPLNF